MSAFHGTGTAAHACTLWGRVTALVERRGRLLGVVDGLIAATALHHGCTVVTRNVADFAGTGVPVFDVWKDQLASRRLRGWRIARGAYPTSRANAARVCRSARSYPIRSRSSEMISASYQPR